MQELIHIGFLASGAWTSGSLGLRFELTVPIGDKAPALYAFVVEEELLYLGKTRQPLQQRLYGYQQPGPTQKTNVRVHEYLKSATADGQSIRIFAFVSDVPLRVGRFKVDLAAGLEDDLIAQLHPLWNKSGVRPRQQTEATGPVKEQHANEPKRQVPESSAVDKEIRPHFLIALGKTYYMQGFFNVPVDYARYFPRDGHRIRVVLGATGERIDAEVNRRTNKQTDAPRIMGGARFSDWIRTTFRQGEHMRVVVRSKEEIYVSCT